MQEWRKKRDGKTGIAMKFRFSLKSDTVYDESDISATSNSWCRSMRKNVSSTGMSRYVRSMPSGWMRPSSRPRVRS